MTIYCHNDSEMNVLCITFIDTDNRVRIWGEDRGNGKRGEPDSNLHDPHRHSLKTFLIHLSQNFMLICYGIMRKQTALIFQPFSKDLEQWFSTRMQGPTLGLSKFLGGPQDD